MKDWERFYERLGITRAPDESDASLILRAMKTPREEWTAGYVCAWAEQVAGRCARATVTTRGRHERTVVVEVLLPWWRRWSRRRRRVVARQIEYVLGRSRPVNTQLVVRVPR